MGSMDEIVQKNPPANKAGGSIQPVRKYLKIVS
jgi:hypothetical protein